MDITLTNVFKQVNVTLQKFYFLLENKEGGV